MRNEVEKALDECRDETAAELRLFQEGITTPRLEEEGIGLNELLSTAEDIVTYLQDAVRCERCQEPTRRSMQGCAFHAGMAHYLSEHLQQLADALKVAEEEVC